MAKWFSKKSKHMRDFDEDAAGVHANHADMDAFTRAEPSTTPQTLGNARQASVASAREAQGTFDSPFTWSLIRYDAHTPHRLQNPRIPVMHELALLSMQKAGPKA